MPLPRSARWTGRGPLTFEAPDRGVSRRIGLAYGAGRGGGCPGLPGAANEVAVSAFLDGALGWAAIADVVEETLEGWVDDPVDQVEGVLEADAEAPPAGPGHRGATPGCLKRPVALDGA